jgi:Protein of unknown function (DUF3341)
MSTRHTYGLVGEFQNPEPVIAATRALRSEGIGRWEIYGPAPIEEIDREVPTRRGTVITSVMVLAAIAGFCIGYFFQYWGAVLDYPLNVGGRPYNSWPGFVPSAWEICAVFTVYFGFFAFCVSCGLSRLYHPIFATHGFERASQDRFFLCIEATAQRYDAERLQALLERHGALHVAELEL